MVLIGFLLLLFLLSGFFLRLGFSILKLAISLVGGLVVIVMVLIGASIFIPILGIVVLAGLLTLFA